MQGTGGNYPALLGAVFVARCHLYCSQFWWLYDDKYKFGRGYFREEKQDSVLKMKLISCLKEC